MRRFVLFVVALATPGLYAQPVPGTTVDLSSCDVGAGIGGTVHAAAVGPDGRLYVGGAFERAGTDSASNVARWNGTTWEALGTGTDDTVYALTFSPDGDLYVGGQFTMAGGRMARRVARWDGQDWHPVETGGSALTSGTVYTLAFSPSGDLYAAGSLSQYASRIAVWNGSAWDGLGSGTASLLTGEVRALAFAPDGTLYAGGWFDGPGSLQNIAEWNPTSIRWESLGFSGLNGSVEELIVAEDGSLIASGWFNEAESQPALGVARWDGSSWDPLAGGVEVGVTALSLSPDGGLVAGFTSATATSLTWRLATWDGSEWTERDGGIGASVSDLTHGPDGTLYVVGDVQTAGSLPTQGVVSWNAGIWSGYGSAASYWVRTLAEGTDGSIYAAGGLLSICDTVVPDVARWDGATWQAVGMGSPSTQPAQVEDVAVGPDGQLYAVGRFLRIGGARARYVARWDGTVWSEVGTAPYLGSFGSFLTVAFGPGGRLYAGGYGFQSPSNTRYPALWVWDGEDWTSLIDPGSDSGFAPMIRALQFGPDGHLYVGGRFSEIDGLTTTNVARWDGSEWSAIGGGIGGAVATVWDLAFGRDGSLYAGGHITEAIGSVANGIARWNGTEWTSVGGGVLNEDGFGGWVTSLHVGDNGLLFAGGSFSRAGTVDARNLAAWDGTDWTAVGAGADDTVFDLATDPSGALYLAGDFDRIGEVVTPRIGQIVGIAVESEPTPTEPAPDEVAVYPNPTTGRASLQLTIAPGDEPIRIELFDPLGRRVARFHEGRRTSGRASLPLDLRDLAPGVYTIRATVGSSTTTSRVLVVR